MSGPGDLRHRNKAAWDALYRSTRERIWGTDPLPFVTDPRHGVAAHLPEGGRVLDAGSGEGRHLAFLRSLTPDVHAVDASHGGLGKVPDAVRGRVGAAVADLEALPYADGAFDLILCCDVLETLPDAGRVLRELARVLRPGGHLLCNMPDDDDPIAGEGMDPTDTEGFLFQGRYFYRFVDEVTAAALLTSAGLAVAGSRSWSWTEEAHPNFREESHRHTSRVYLARKPGGG